MLDLRTLTDEQLGQLRADVTAEHDRRRTLAAAQDRIIQANRDYLAAEGTAPGDPYRAPTGYHDAYPHGWEVTHDDKTWVSTRDGATGVPGDSPDWRQVAQEDEILPWVQPHAGSEYPVGAKVTHNGRIWENTHTGPNGWEPGRPGAQWTDLGPEQEDANGDA